MAAMIVIWSTVDSSSVGARPRASRSRMLRATYLSLQSLLGRLAFSGTLLALAAGATPGAAPGWPALASMSLTCAVAGAAGLAVLAVTARPCLAALKRDA
jgi:hypothetical protein